MIESPLIQEVLADRMHRAIADVLRDRFVMVPDEIIAQLKLVQDDAKLSKLLIWASKCPDLDAFRARLS